MNNFPLKEHSLMFAPLEGITDEYYRQVIFQLYPEWDTQSCDFLRVPNPSPYPQKHIIKHFGNEIYKGGALKDKSIYQILTSPGAYTEQTVSDIRELGFTWLDLNLGCPSKTVCKHHGGSYLLSELTELRPIIKTIRAHFPHTFTAKIRVGYKDDNNFEQILKLLEEEGVDGIVIHARTRDELYKGVAKWDYVKTAVQTVKTPIIGNGDIWSTDDIERYFDYTGCHSVMLGRSAMKTPWLARLYKKGEKDTAAVRVGEIQNYYHVLFETFTRKAGLEEASAIKRIKALSRYLFDDFEDGEEIKRRILRAKSFQEQLTVISELSSHFL